MGGNKEEGIKKYFIKNSYNLVFSILALLTLIFFIISVAKINLFSQITGLVSSGMWFLLFVSFSGSSVLAYFEKYKWMVLPVFIWLLIFTVQIRTANVSQLIDVSTGNYTLGPDLDPFLYLRHVYEINAGNIPKVDLMRYAPVGATNYATRSLMPWAILGIYKVALLFSNTTINYSAIITPVILFLISLIGFFIFVNIVFSKNFGNKRASIIALIASFFYSFSPQMIHRTTGGIPEIESLGMVFFWFALSFFVLAWKKSEKRNWILFGILSGLFTGLMSWSWGGYRYIYMILGLASLIAFVFEKENKKSFIIFSSWAATSIFFEFSKSWKLSAIIQNLPSTGFALGVLGLMIVSLIIRKIKLKRLEKINFPKNLLAIGVTLLLGIFVLLIFDPKLIWETISKVVGGLLFPFGRGRVGMTVAENKAPYFVDAMQQIGYIIWAFLLSIILIFYESIKKFGKKERNILFASFCIMIAGMVFSRISSVSMLNGDNFISSLVYIGGIVIFAASSLILFTKAYRQKDVKLLENFSSIDISSIILIAISFWAIVSIRGAIRLFFIISPMVILVSSYLPLKLVEYKKKTKDELIGIILIILIISSIIVFAVSLFQYSGATINEAKATVPGIYEQQWQRAMKWVRENTPTESIFVQWWDYGYWIQTLGERATVTDGGHFSSYWDHLIGRYVLTSNNSEEVQSFMKSHNSSYILIDSTDLGKYAAYSIIGSDENFDRFSAITLMRTNNAQTKESNSSITRIYEGVGGLDDDVLYSDGETEVIIPGPTYDELGNANHRAYVIGVILEKNELTQKFSQPQAVYFYNQKQIILPMRYLYYNGEMIDFKSGLESVYMIVPQLYSSDQGVALDQIGSGVYLSEKVSGTLFAQLYLLDDAFGKFKNFNIKYIEEDIVVQSLKMQGMSNIGNFVDYNGFRGPIKIWELQENPNIITHEEFLKLDGEYAEFDNLQFAK